MRGARQGISTIAIHKGEFRDALYRPVIPPIYQTTIFDLENSRSALELMAGRKKGYFYTRYGNPNQSVLEEKLAALEHGEKALVLASGNGATTASILCYAKTGDHVVSTRDIYGGTYAIFTDLMSRAGIRATFVDSTSLEEVAGALKDNTKVVFIESPTNPTMKVSDLEEIAVIAHDAGVRMIVDNTFATPYNQNPLDWGADMVLHSLTKYINGHSDVVGGALVGSARDMARCRELMKMTGASLNPFEAWLAARGLKTLAVRMERHNANALAVAEFLEGHRKVERVYYPGLKSHPQRKLARKYMRGYSGMVSFVVKGGLRGASAMWDRLKLCRRAVSLGGVETLASIPAMTTHYHVPKEERMKAGIVDGMVRLSVGIEDVEDIIADLRQALA